MCKLFLPLQRASFSLVRGTQISQAIQTSVEVNITMHASGLLNICAINILHYHHEQDRDINIEWE